MLFFRETYLKPIDSGLFQLGITNHYFIGSLKYLDKVLGIVTLNIIIAIWYQLLENRLHLIGNYDIKSSSSALG